MAGVALLVETSTASISIRTITTENKPSYAAMIPNTTMLMAAAFAAAATLAIQSAPAAEKPEMHQTNDEGAVGTNIGSTIEEGYNAAYLDIFFLCDADHAANHFEDLPSDSPHSTMKPVDVPDDLPEYKRLAAIARAKGQI